jgi:hypothetical protein
VPAWNSADLLAAFKREAGLNDASEYNDDLDLYPRLSIAQCNVIRRVASIFPNCLYPAPFTLTRASDGKTYSFGTDAQSNPIVPMGWVQVATSLSAFSGDDFYGWREGRDFINEGERIRLPSNRSSSQALYCRAVLAPPDINSSVNPVLSPADGRELIAIQAVMDWAGEGDQQPSLVARMERKMSQKFPILMLSLRRAYRGGGAGFDPARWYLASPDLGTSR